MRRTAPSSGSIWTWSLQRRTPPVRTSGQPRSWRSGGGADVDDETVLLVREYAAGMHRYELGLVKGGSMPATPEQAADRELKEEAGFARAGRCCAR